MLITAGEDQKIKFWSMQMKLLFLVDLGSVNSEPSQVPPNRSACSLDIFCCHEPKNYLQGKSRVADPTSRERKSKLTLAEKAPEKKLLKSRVTKTVSGQTFTNT